MSTKTPPPGFRAEDAELLQLFGHRAGGDERTSAGAVAEAVARGGATPEEQLEASHVAVRGNLAEYLLERVK
jgi:hypothetical protein